MSGSNENVSRMVVLRSERSATDSRHLTAALNLAGDVVFEGQDLGEGVEKIFGSREYEWVWTVKAKDVPLLAKALGQAGDLLARIEAEFGGEKAANLYAFLESREIPVEKWSRVGD